LSGEAKEIFSSTKALKQRSQPRNLDQ